MINNLIQNIFNIYVRNVYHKSFYILKDVKTQLCYFLIRIKYHLFFKQSKIFSYKKTRIKQITYTRHQKTYNSHLCFLMSFVTDIHSFISFLKWREGKGVTIKMAVAGRKIPLAQGTIPLLSPDVLWTTM